jgi:hypothetical protein
VRSVLAACLAWLVLAPSAAASTTQESVLQDDPMIVYADSDERLGGTFAVLRALGVDRVRVSVFWNLIAPKPKSRTRPSFGPGGAASPDSYPESHWERYDRIARLAERHDLGLLFTLTGPGPAWAARTSEAGYSVYKPKPSDFRAFVTAVGRRYSGSYVPEPAPEPAPTPEPDPLPIPLPIQFGTDPPQPQAAASDPLPRVDHWSLWNEGNFPSWLAPQSRRTRLRSYNGFMPYAPHLYRRLVDAAWDGLRASGHGSDLVLLGETAPRGGRRGLNTTLPPLRFLRETYCLDESFRPFRGADARGRGCPDTRRERRAFRRANPGLFLASGWAHHPYSLDHRPTWSHRSANSIPLGSINRLISAYDRSRFAWGDVGQGDIWITEYGYQTKPDPYVAVPLVRQALWTTWAEFVAYRNPRIASMAQFLLRDDAPDTRFGAADFRRWRTWQSGLLTASGDRKPLYDEYPLPIYVTPTTTRAGRSVRVWGTWRPSEDGAPLVAEIQALGDDGGFQTIKEVTVTNPKGYLDTRVRTKDSASLRVLWYDPASVGGGPTRAVPVTVD